MLLGFFGIVTREKVYEKNFINYVIVLFEVWSLSRVILIVPLNTLKVNNVIVLG